MLLQGDIKGAEYAFTTVTQAEPEYSDGWLNLARALIQEGETDAAKPHIQKAIELNPAAGRNYFFRAAVEKADGDYPAAIASLRRVIQQYPRDRVALNQLARVLFLSRQYAESLEILADVAKVDPEDLQMHYTAMLAHRGAGNMEAAARSETRFKRFKAEESAQAITGDRRRANPDENNERQAIHEHVGMPLAPAQLRATSTTKPSGSRVGGGH
jgi:tetratricopeptide (TPR) repeat protein